MGWRELFRGKKKRTEPQEKPLMREEIIKNTLIENEDFSKNRSEHIFKTIFFVKQKPLEDALSKTYDVSFPSIQRTS